ncbi:hypothetical protein FOCC_FOCC015440 [Frankliniella occidentalis]|nr:hypothetical protein FOCC_FOCC015440 [Frankliniella occidentalis]
MELSFGKRKLPSIEEGLSPFQRRAEQAIASVEFWPGAGESSGSPAAATTTTPRPAPCKLSRAWTASARPQAPQVRPGAAYGSSARGAARSSRRHTQGSGARPWT